MKCRAREVAWGRGTTAGGSPSLFIAVGGQGQVCPLPVVAPLFGSGSLLSLGALILAGGGPHVVECWWWVSLAGGGSLLCPVGVILASGGGPSLLVAGRHLLEASTASPIIDIGTPCVLKS